MKDEKTIQEILNEDSLAPTTTGANGDPHKQAHKKDPHAQERIEKTAHSFFGFFVTRFRLTLLVIIAIVSLGALAVSTIPREADPEVKIPVAVVTTFFPGASPLDVENLVTDKVETKIEELDDVKLVTSSSVLGLSSVTVEFEAEADLEDSIRNLKDKVLEIRGLPDDAEDPIVTEVRIDDQPIITFSLAGPLNEQEFKVLGEYLQTELEKIPGISDAPLLGVQSREFQVIVHKGELERLNIPIGLVVSAIASSNNDTPLGDITLDSTNYNLRTVAKINNLEDLKKIVVFTDQNGQTILLNDIADITDTFSEKNNLSRLSVGGGEAISTISLQLHKKTGGNILNIVDEAKKTLEDFKADGTIPENVSLEVSSDFSQFIRDDLRTLGTSGIQAVILIFFILLIALSYKEAAISLLAIPLTFLITIFVMNFRGDTLNSLALFSLVLSLGLLVDSFIIILEGIFHNLRIGYNSKEAALLAIAHYKNPLLAGTLTTISAFVPMLLVSGILGEFLKVLPITISTVLFSSLFVSIAIVPAIAAVILKNRKPEQSEQDSILEKYVTNRLIKWYTGFITEFLKSRKRKLKFLGLTILAFIVAMGILVSPLVKVELFPKVDIDFSYINVEMPIGTNLETTDKVVRQIEDYLYTRSDIKSFTTSVGSSASFGIGGGSSSNEHVANINITFTDIKERHKKSYEINDAIREDLKFITEGKITVEEITSGPPTGAPIEVRITGEDLDVLDDLTLRLVQVLENTEGVIDIETNKDISPADLTFTLDREALAKSGLSVAEVSGFLRTAIFGVTATEINVDDEDVDVIVKFDDIALDSIEKVKNLSIINQQGQSVKLSRVADFSLEPALATIRHRDFDRTSTVQANLETGYTPTEVVPQVEKMVNEQYIPDGYAYNFGGEVEDIEQSFSELWSAMIVAVLLILTILVLQFNSFKKPIIILLELPLMMIGVVVGMLVFRMPFSFSSFLGIISLAGIVVNDAIVLLDKADRNVGEHKMNPRQAIANAGATRLQPIILTSVTTVAGVLPLAFADEFWFGLSIAIIFGITFATILQLFILPMIYLKLEGKSILKQQNK